MKKIMPQPKVMEELPPRAGSFDGIRVCSNCKNTEGAEDLFQSRFWNMKNVLKDGADSYSVCLNDAPGCGNGGKLFYEQGFVDRKSVV